MFVFISKNSNKQKTLLISWTYVQAFFVSWWQCYSLVPVDQTHSQSSFSYNEFVKLTIAQNNIPDNYTVLQNTHYRRKKRIRIFSIQFDFFPKISRKSPTRNHFIYGTYNASTWTLFYSFVKLVDNAALWFAYRLYYSAEIQRKKK